jgi:hypothetical protein
MEEGKEEWKRERKIGRTMKKKWKKERNSEKEKEIIENIKKSARGTMREKENYTNQTKWKREKDRSNVDSKEL